MDKANVLPSDLSAAEEIKDSTSLFTASTEAAHLEILRILRENEPDTISIVAIGPLTNVAMAAIADTKTFLRAKELVVMGGSLEMAGNVTLSYPLPSLPAAPEPPPPFNLIKAPDTPLRRSLNIRNQMTPVAEFNTYADSVAAARVFALTSPNPASTMPPVPPLPSGQQSTEPPPPFLNAYPTDLGGRRLKLTLAPLGMLDEDS